ncbi:endonuclease/exonuclease/phosphatase family protein [Piscinibacter sakaiensis]|uniref:endonuclease/exonuclease/phosphatase family protein n=1 Tax=Piscinibacter sakaiensis TaxID=1547922 RepID=UPI003AAB7F3A
MSGTAEPSTPTAPALEPFTLRVLTVNTHKGFSSFNRRFILHDLRDAVREVGADIVFLQEVQGAHQTHARRWANWPETPHYEFLADQIWADFAYGRNAIYPHGDHGNAVLSKFPITSYQNRDISILGPEKRGMLHCVLELPSHLGRQLHVVCIHLGLRERHRQRQLELLRHMLDNDIPADATVIVAGDFNDWRRRANAILRGSGLQEVFDSAHGASARSFPARFPLLRLDRIYVRNARRHRPINLHRHPWSRLSDHAPLAAEVSL